MELLDRDALVRGLAPLTRAALDGFEVFREVDSTNAHLLREGPPAPGRLRVALTEHQTAGRGRHGRRWSMPFGGGVLLSTGFRFQVPPAQIAALSLAIGVTLREALAAAGAPGVTLKWPNDLVWQDGKLGGILVEVAGNDAGFCYVVAGVGLNLCLSDEARAAIDTVWGRGPVDLADVCGGSAPSRHQIAIALINALHGVLDGYQAQGFEPYRARFGAADMLAGRSVQVTIPDGQLTGYAAGVDRDGALLVRTAAGQRRIVAGEVRLQAR